jgi:hypothetical protein
VESIEAVAIAITAYRYAQRRETHSSHIWGSGGNLRSVQYGIQEQTPYDRVMPLMAR